MFSKKKKLCTIGVMILLLLVGGCSSTTSTVSVKKQWADSIRSFGLTPIYPMRENVYVGNLHLTGDKNDDFSLNYRVYDIIDLSQALKETLSKLPELPKTQTVLVDRINADGKTIKIPKYTQDDTQDVTAKRKNFNRMHLVALPSVKIASATAAGIVASLPRGVSSAISNVLGLGVSSKDEVDITLEGIELLEVPDKAAWEAFNDICKNNISNSSALSVSLSQVAGEKDGKSDSEKIDGYLHLITRVFYTRSIVFSKKKEVAAKLQTQTGGSTNPNISTTTPDTGNADTPGNLKPSVTTQTLDISQPGVAASLLTKSNSAIELRQIFDYPLAFGVDQLTIGLLKDGFDKITCKETPVSNNRETLTGTGEPA